MNLSPCSLEPGSIEAYKNLFAKCFPSAHHLDETYLNWLYGANPEGAVVGYDAFDGEQLAAHYACVPASAIIEGRRQRGLLSLNTATHPDFQGKGLFTKLAAATYEYAANNGYSFVYGVANANSTPGFIRKLGFTLVTPLDARIGFGRLSVKDWQRTTEQACFHRDWSEQSFRWRVSNPANPVTVGKMSNGSVALECDSRKTPLIRAYAENWLPSIKVESQAPFSPLGKVFIGLFPSGTKPYGTFVSIPQRFRPAPLNLIFRDLLGTSALDASSVVLNFLDFDAF